MGIHFSEQKKMPLGFAYLQRFQLKSQCIYQLLWEIYQFVVR